MAAPSKKRATEEEMKLLEEKHDEENMDELEEESDMEDGSEDSDMVEEEIQVDFEARSPEDCDFDGIRKLLHQSYLKANVNISELADTIISQNYVGSIIKQSEAALDEEDSEDDDDADVFGVLTVINITERKELDCVKQIKSLILDRCKECADKQRDGWSKLFHSGQELGLIVSERFINIPPQIALPSYESLQKEMTKAAQKQMKYSFHYFVMISKTYRFPKSAAVSNKQASDQLVFANAEEEFIYDEAEMKFDFSVAAQRDTVVGGMWDDDDGEMVPYRTVMAIPSGKMDSIMTKMRENLSMPT